MERRLQVHILSFEGPDDYARAGGIASRVAGLAEALGHAGSDAHLWFIGDPELPGHESRNGMTLHRWCQWISRHHSGGVYDGEEGKRSDYASSLPPYLIEHHLLPHLSDPEARAAILAEEWHTVDAVLHLDWLLRRAGVRDRVALFWNANNTFGFDRIDWKRLATAATITTVSRYMRCRMWPLGVDPIVIPNGLPGDIFWLPEPTDVSRLRKVVGRRAVFAKVARWDPDKRWLLAVDTVSDLKRRGARPLLVARGGLETHGREVTAHADEAGLRVTPRALTDPGAGGLLDAMGETADTDVLVLTSPLDREASQLLFAASSAVLANSGHEPFGLVGLETMAAGGVACVGGTGEDYVVPGWNGLVLQTLDPREFVTQFQRLSSHPDEEQALRRHALETAERFTWSAIVTRSLLPRVGAALTASDMESPLVRASDPASPSPVPPVARVTRRTLMRATIGGRQAGPSLHTAPETPADTL
jgi:glycosyltransferase involved in cell wall biosynthesis